MILVNPEWGGEKAEDIWALYYYLLYRVLPFSPSDYLPQDEKGFFYYDKGDRHTARIYPMHPNKEFVDTLSLYDQIKSVSVDLCDFLFIDRTTVNRNHLRELLTTPTDQETLSKGYLTFSLTTPKKGKRALAKAWKPILTEIFNYKAFSSEPLFPRLIQLLGVETCPYCNRSFTTTAKINNREYQRHNQIDHYRPKATHPWFALSLLNFIPSCGNCNLRKGNDDSFVLYPYYEEFGTVYRFRTVPLSGLGYLTGQPGSEDTFEVEIEQIPDTMPGESYKKRVEHSIFKFGLDVLYRKSHNAYVKGIFEQRFLICDAYLDSLCASFPDHFKNREDVRRMLYLKPFDENELDKSPLAKLTHDINSEISELIKEDTDENDG